MQTICDTTLGFLDSSLISKAFGLKVKADHFHYIAEFTEAGTREVGCSGECSTYAYTTGGIVHHSLCVSV